MSANLKMGSTTEKKRHGRFGRIILTTLVVLAIGGGAAWYLMGKNTQAKAAAAQASSATLDAAVERGDIRLTASGQGTLVTNEAVNMSFTTSGKVAELNVKLGDMVKKGDVLARLEKAEDLEASLASAQASLLQAQQDLAEMQKKASASLAKAYQDFATAKAAYDDALKESQRSQLTRCSPELLNKYKAELEKTTEKLNALHLVDPSSEEAIVAGYDHDTAVANYSYCNAYTAIEKTSAQSTLEVAKVTYQEAEDTYNTLLDASGIDPDRLSMLETRVETAQAQVDTAQEAVDGMTLVAAINGKITYLAASAGAIVSTSTFLTISDVSHPTVTVTMDETDMDKLVVGNAAVVSFTALPGKTFTGKVSLANPAMISFGPFRAASGQVTLDEEFVSTLEKMQLGMSASITISGKGATNALLIPVAALKQLNNGDYVVNLVGSDGQTTQQTVSVGLQDDTYAEVAGGLQEGDVVRYTVKNSSSSSQEGGFMGGGNMPPIP